VRPRRTFSTQHHEKDYMTLHAKKIAILIAPRGTEEPEFVQPRDAVTKAGASVTVIGLEAGEAC